MARRKPPDAPAAEGTTSPPGDRKPPAHEVRIGRVRCTVWENQHETQGTWFSVTFSRSYKDSSGTWKSAHSFGRDDLLVLAEASRLAFFWVARKNGAAGVPDEPVEPSGTEPEIPI
jgi:hypothetical protein